MSLRGVNWIARALERAPAVPAGGAYPQGRGRDRGIIIALALLAAPAVAQVPADAPSGQQLTLSEVLLDDAPGELWLRFRFLAPGIARQGGTVDQATASADMGALCETLALPYVTEQKLDIVRIAISMMDRDIPFGETDPAVTQFFEVYRPEDGRCIWEPF
ncbi:MAG: hypothetical protein KDK24_18645 [Pseudooceanicola sp.]|nr:hypothetical protein [Pseudooceanicola sp.]